MYEVLDCPVCAIHDGFPLRPVSPLPLRRLSPLYSALRLLDERYAVLLTETLCLLDIPPGPHCQDIPRNVIDNGVDERTVTASEIERGFLPVEFHWLPSFDDWVFTSGHSFLHGRSCTTFGYLRPRTPYCLTCSFLGAPHHPRCPQCHQDGRHSSGFPRFAR